MSDPDLVETSNEGLGNRRDYCRRQDTVEQLTQLVQRRRALQLCAPPFSGKTSLATLLHRHLLSLNEKVYLLKMLETRKPVHEYFSHRVTTWSSFLSSREPRYLIIDEGQLTYTLNDEFWTVVKAVVQGGYHNLYIFIFCAYGGHETTTLVTPFVFPDSNRIHLSPQHFPDTSREPAISLPGLLFTPSELREFVQRHLRLRFSETAFSYLYALTNGHAGLSDLALHFLELRLPRHCLVQPLSDPGEHKDPPESLLTSEYMKLLMSRDFHNFVLSGSRGCPVRSNMTDAELSLCELILQRDGTTVDMVENKFQSDTLASLVKKGYLQVCNRRASFACPIFARSYLIQSRIMEWTDFHVPQHRPLFAFLCEAIKRMQPSQFAHTHSHGTNGIPYERLFQMEFYRIARSMLPPECFVNPDVGYCFFTAGFMDFYVNSGICWGIELLRNGESWDEHLARFRPHGRYAPMIDHGYIKEWAILDCRTVSRSPPETTVSPNCTIVCFASDYETATIYHGDTVEDVHLFGDRVNEHSIMGAREKRKPSSALEKTNKPKKR